MKDKIITILMGVNSNFVRSLKMNISRPTLIPKRILNKL